MTHPVHAKIDEARKAISQTLQAEMKKVNESGLAINPFVYAEALIFEASALIQHSIAESISVDGLQADSTEAEALMNILEEKDALSATYDEFHESVNPNETSVLLAMTHTLLEVTHALNHEIEDNLDQSIPSNKPSNVKDETDILKDFFGALRS